MSYFDADEIGPYPNYTEMCRQWYHDPVWKRIPVFPGLDVETHELSTVYTALEIESVGMRYGQKLFNTLVDYKDLFKDLLEVNGARILVQGDPGVGKTTFTHKLAYDWACGDLDYFDAVFVVKLRFAEKNETIPAMIIDQNLSLRDENSSPDLLQKYLKSGTERVLLVLDGMDEIELDDPIIKDIMAGKEYRKCVIMFTTRPYVSKSSVMTKTSESQGECTAISIRNKMSRVANIRGFTLDRAKKYISNIIHDETVRDRFFKQLERRNMSQMHKAPIMLQALALIFSEVGEDQLPETMTTTFDYLIVMLREACEAKGEDAKTKPLTQEEIDKAMQEVNKLAFEGLTRDSRQLVFDRNEIKNPNVFRLGVLTAEGVGVVTRKTVLQSPHKTVQEYHAAHYMATLLVNGDRKPWDKIKQIYQTKVMDDAEFFPVTRHTTIVGSEKHEEPGCESKTLKEVLGKIKTHLGSGKVELDEATWEVTQCMVDGGFFDDELDKQKMWKEFRKLANKLKMEMTEAEQRIAFEYMMDLTFATSVQWRQNSLDWTKSLLSERGKTSRRLTSGFSPFLPVLLSVAEEDPEMARQFCIEESKIFERDGTLAFHGEFVHILEDIQSHKILFSFLAGKLGETSKGNESDTGEEILREIADAAIGKSFDPITGGALQLRLLETYLTDIIKEFLNSTSKSRMIDQTCNSICMINENNEKDTRFVKHPMIFHLDRGNYMFDTSNEKGTAYRALKISGTKGVVAMKKIIENLESWNSQNNMHISLIEIEYLNYEFDSEERTKFVNTLFRRPVSSLEIRGCSPELTEQLASSLPISMQRLFVLQGEVNLFKLPRKTQLKVLEVDGFCHSES